MDITRLADRFLQNCLSTGGDRVSLQYLLHFIDRSYALIRFAGRWVELGRADSRRVFEALLDGGSEGRSVIRRCVAQAYMLSWRGRHCGVLFNTGHSGLDRPDYGVAVVKRCLKPVFFSRPDSPLVSGIPQSGRGGALSPVPV